MKPQSPDRDTATPREAPVELRSLVGKQVGPAAAPARASAGAATLVDGAVGAAPGTAAVLGLPVAPERYAMQKRLGEGAMGEVFSAKDSFLLRRVAFKRMNRAVSSSPALASRFLTEAQITAQLEHPNIIPIYGLETTADGSVGYAMKFIEGRTLTDLLDEARATIGKRSPAEEAAQLAERLRIFTRICDALAYAHAKGVLHRDLKPDNVMIGRFNQVYVVDWGICRVMHREEEVLDPSAGANPVAGGGGQATQFGSLLETPAYMSPEQAAGRHAELDGRSDLYALGLILFELVTLRQAVVGDSIQALLLQAVQGEKAPLVHLDPRIRIPIELRAIIFKATALAKDKRYADVAEFTADLRRFTSGEAVLALPDTPVRMAMRWISRHRGATLAALLFTILVASGLVLFLQLRHAASVAKDRRHRQRLQALMLAVSQHGHRVDNRLHAYQQLLFGLSGRTVEALRSVAPASGVKAEAAPRKTAKAGKAGKAGSPQKPARRGKQAAEAEETRAASSRQIYFSEDFGKKDRSPPDLVENPRYGHKVSFGFPVFKLAPSVDAESVRSDLDHLAQLSPSYRSMYERSGKGLYRLFVTLKSGVHVAYPRRGGFPAEYDGRERPKYRLAAEERELRWGNIYRDIFGEPLLPCSFPLYSDEDKFLGVAGFDLLISEMAEQLLPLPELPAVRNVFLVDKEGRIGVSYPGGAKVQRQEGEVGTLDGNRTIALSPLPYPEVIAALHDDPTGGYRELKEEVVAYYPVSALGFYLVVVADHALLFQGRQSR